MVSRFVDWLLSLDPYGGPPIYAAECTTCDEASSGAESREDPEVWCLRHAARTGHTGFRSTVTTFLRATPRSGLSSGPA
ncbi:hypothetical protein E1265_22890 [Streptomyces sp. 8K308]|uniref:DUF7848 domain-containing protein n=1 Tax=Streptomyces sp. 8K308 TaxID=2530388 RepID=UPI0010454D90|nr:hypothetical protein [Streptomyces sp. 8K308]TDC19981.1 hypothetical protein E1265_22890 [Streptomyces sp. 8K308]